MDSQPIKNVFVDMPIIDSDVREFEYRRFIPDSTVAVTGGNLSEINIDCRTAGLDSFLLPSRAYLLVKYKLFAADMTTEIAAAKQQMLASPAHLFSEVAISLGGEHIERRANPGLIYHVKHLVEHSREDIISNGPAKRYFPPFDYVALDSVHGASDDAFVDAQLARAGALYATKTTENYALIRLRDLSGFCEINKCFYGGNFSVRLTPRSSAWQQAFFGSDTSTVGSARILDCQLYMPMLRPETNLMLEMSKAILGGQIIPVQFQSWTVQSKSLTGAAGQYTETITNQAKRPVALIVALQDDRRNTNRLYNPLYFDACSLTDHHVDFNGKSFPALKYKGSNNGYIHEYQEFLRLSGKDDGEVVGSFVEYDNFRQVYPLWAYNLEHLRDEYNSVRTGGNQITWNAYLSNGGSAVMANFIVVANEYIEIKALGNAVSITAPTYKD